MLVRDQTHDDGQASPTCGHAVTKAKICCSYSYKYGPFCCPQKPAGCDVFAVKEEEEEEEVLSTEY